MLKLKNQPGNIAGIAGAIYPTCDRRGATWWWRHVQEVRRDLRAAVTLIECDVTHTTTLVNVLFADFCAGTCDICICALRKRPKYASSSDGYLMTSLTWRGCEGFLRLERRGLGCVWKWGVTSLFFKPNATSSNPGACVGYRMSLRSWSTQVSSDVTPSKRKLTRFRLLLLRRKYES